MGRVTLAACFLAHTHTHARTHAHTSESELDSNDTRNLLVLVDPEKLSTHSVPLRF